MTDDELQHRVRTWAVGQLPPDIAPPPRPPHEFRVFIGFDSKEPVTHAVALHSLMAHASRPLQVTPLIQRQLRTGGQYTRPRGPTEATEFSLTRFLVPFLSGFKGYSLFVDSDVLFQADAFDLLLYPLAHPGKAVYVCQHDYIPKSVTKMDGQEQTTYPRKNWSSVMLFNNAHCQTLYPEYINKATGLALHRFHWLREDQIGSLPLEWNWLVGEYEPNPQAKLLHYTLGAPCFPEYRHCDHADVWKRACLEMLKPAKMTEEGLDLFLDCYSSARSGATA